MSELVFAYMAIGGLLVVIAGMGGLWMRDRDVGAARHEEHVKAVRAHGEATRAATVDAIRLLVASWTHVTQAQQDSSRRPSDAARHRAREAMAAFNRAVVEAGRLVIPAAEAQPSSGVRTVDSVKEAVNG